MRDLLDERSFARPLRIPSTPVAEWLCAARVTERRRSLRVRPVLLRGCNNFHDCVVPAVRGWAAVVNINQRVCSGG
jgi:hypothetical protein